jgi:hypothetical protein
MKVKTDENGRPKAWGETVKGKEMPEPPGNAKDYRWDGNKWVKDPQSPNLSEKTDKEITNMLRENEVKSEKVLAYFISEGRI